ncbi:hypothetical protein ACJX0J_023082 [Zea mays]
MLEAHFCNHGLMLLICHLSDAIIECDIYLVLRNLTTYLPITLANFIFCERNLTGPALLKEDFSFLPFLRVDAFDVLQRKITGIMIIIIIIIISSRKKQKALAAEKEHFFF